MAACNKPQTPGATCILLRISDTGTGMSAEVRAHLFEPFFTTKQPGRGTGMGLSAVLGTVEAHGGRIEVESAPGSGSSFYLYLPPVPPDSAPPADTPVVPRAVRGTGQILVVDDEPMVRSAITRILEHLGYTVHACAGGPEAIRYITEHPRSTDLVLLDLVLPDMNGIVVLERLRAVSPALKVLVLSGYTDDHSVAQVFERGALALVRKPFTSIELSRTISRFIGSAAASDTA
jgi:hypothetical protein